MIRPKSAILLSIPPNFAQTKDILSIKKSIKNCFSSDSLRYDQTHQDITQLKKSANNNYDPKNLIKDNQTYNEGIHDLIFKSKSQVAQSLSLSNKDSSKNSCVYSFMKKINKSYQCKGMASSVIKNKLNIPYFITNRHPMKSYINPPKIIRKQSSNSLIHQLRKARSYHEELQKKKLKLKEKKKQIINDDIERVQNSCLLIKKISRARKSMTQNTQFYQKIETQTSKRYQKAHKQKDNTQIFIKFENKAINIKAFKPQNNLYNSTRQLRRKKLK